MGGFINIKMGADIRNYQRNMSKAKKTTQGFSLSLGNMVKGGALIGLAAGLTSLAKKSLEVAMRTETMTTSFIAMTGSIEKATELVDELNRFASLTPFRLEGIATASRQIIAAQGSTRGLTNQLKMLGDIASVTGVPLNDMAKIYAKTMNKGILQAEELNQIAERGIPLNRELAKMYGKSTMAIRKMAERGKISFDDLRTALKNMTSEGGIAFDAMERQSRTLAGAMSTATENMEFAISRIAETSLPTLTKATFLATNLFITLDMNMKAMGFGVASVNERISDLRREIIETQAEINKGGRGWLIDEASPEKVAKLTKKLEFLKVALTNLLPKADLKKGLIPDILGELEPVANEVEEVSESFEDLKRYTGSAEREALEFRQTLGKVKNEVEGLTIKTLENVKATYSMEEAHRSFTQKTEDWAVKVQEGMEKYQIGIKAAEQSINNLQSLLTATNTVAMDNLTAQEKAERDKWKAALKGASNYDSEMTRLQESQDERRKRLTAKHARRMKALATAQAIIQGGQAAVNSLATTPGPAKWVDFGLVLAATATQLATIHATSLPSFDKGTTMAKGGPSLIHRDETLVNLPRGTRVISKGMGGGMGNINPIVMATKFDGRDLYLLQERQNNIQNLRNP